jgi:hypothetical protein
MGSEIHTKTFCNYTTMKRPGHQLKIATDVAVSQVDAVIQTETTGKDRQCNGHHKNNARLSALLKSVC